MASEVVINQLGSILEVTINRPDARNALNSSVLAALNSAADLAIRDPSVRVLTIRGSGSSVFSAGADLDEIEGLAEAEAADFLRAGHAVFDSLQHLPVPSIACVSGLALGGGFELALACSLIVADDSARFSFPEARLGLIPGFGGTQRLARALGVRQSLRMMLTGEAITAREAWDRGLLAEAPYRTLDLVARSHRLAEEITASGPLAVSLILELMQSARPATSHLDHEVALAAKAIASKDGREGVNAFRERRKAVFHDR